MIYLGSVIFRYERGDRANTDPALNICPIKSVKGFLKKSGRSHPIMAWPLQSWYWLTILKILKGI